MNIQIRVMSQQAAAQIKALQAQVNGLNRQLGNRSGFNAMNAGMGAAMMQGTRWGNQMQWTGRQLQYNFGLPLAIAGAAATKWALDNEKAMVRVVKVYGDGSMAASQVKSETDALGRAFEALSERFGVNQAEVIEVAGAWAAAGASGIALARATRLSMEAMVLGELEAVEATQALIAIQAQYGIETVELSKAIDTLNMIENDTGISMGELIQGMSRAAGTARTAGIDIRTLGALLAGLTPAAGTAANAGNALKTILSRLMSPTGEAAAILGEMNIELDDMSWKTANGAERLEVLAQKFAGLSDAQKVVVSSTIASRWQINRFDVLMRELVNTNGYYQRSLEATRDPQANFIQKQKELNAVLSSNPQRLKIIWVTLQNAMADVIQPLIPYMVYLASLVAQLGNAFAALPAPIQMTVIGLAASLAVFALLVRYLGSTITLLAVLGHTFRFALIPITAVTGALLMLVRAPLGLFASGIGLVTGAFLGVSSALVGLGKILMGFSAMQTLVVAMLMGWSLIKQAFVAGAIAAGRALWSMVPTRAAALAALYALDTVFLRSMKLAWLYLQLWWVTSSLRVNGVLLGLRLNFLGTLRALDAVFLRWARLQWLTLQLWWVTSLAATHARLIAARTYVLGVLYALDTVFLRSMKLAWLSVQLWWVTSWTAAHARFVSARAAILGTLYALDTVFLRALKLTWLYMQLWWVSSWAARYSMFLSARTAALALLFALDTKFLNMLKLKWATFYLWWTLTAAVQGTRLRAIWAAVWSSIVAMQAAFNLKMIALQAAMYAKMAAMNLAKLLINPYFLAFGLILGLAYAFRNQITSIWQGTVDVAGAAVRGIADWFRNLAPFFNNVVTSIQSAFNRLPQAVQNAFLSVVRIVAAAARQVYEWMSYLNPFARHSPSLVDNVTAGLDTVAAKYNQVPAMVSGPLNRAQQHLEAFNRMMASLGSGEFSDERVDIAKYVPSALGLFDALIGDLRELNNQLRAQRIAVDSQQQATSTWEMRLRAANDVLDMHRDKLEDAENALNNLEDAYKRSEQAMQDYASAPITGMMKMDDAIFSNRMEQQKLRLEMALWEKEHGSVDELRDRLAALQGDIETMRGNAADLRNAGAGSEILGPINAEIAKLEQAYAAAQKAGDPKKLEGMQKELDKLQNEGEIMDLERSITFDPLTRQIEQLANAQKEMAFDAIVAGIKAEQAAMEALRPQIDAATKAVEQNRAAVEQAEVVRDAVSDRYDIENEKLQALKEQYDATAEAIRNVEGALRDLGQVGSNERQLAEEAERARKQAEPRGAGEEYISPAVEAFRASEGGDFADVGGSALIGREGGMGDQTAEIDAFTEGIEKEVADAFKEMDMFGPLKEMWNKAWGWLKENVGPVVTAVWDTLKAAFSGVPSPFEFMDWLNGTGFGRGLIAAWNFLFEVGRDVVNGLRRVWELFAPDVRRILEAVVGAVREAWDRLGPQFAAWVDMLKPIMDALRVLWDLLLKPLAAFLIGTFLAALKLVASVISNTLGPVFEFIIATISYFLQFFRGVVNIIVGIITGDFTRVWTGIKEIVGAAFGQIGAIIKAAAGIIWGVVKGIVVGIYEFFVWLWDVLVGHSIVPDIVNGIVAVFKGLAFIAKWIFDNVLMPIFNFFKIIWDRYLYPIVQTIVSLVVKSIQTWITVAKWVWDNVLMPIFNFFKTLWDRHLFPLVKTMVDLVRRTIEGWRTIGQWVFDNVLMPIFNFFKTLWDRHLFPLVRTMVDLVRRTIEGWRTIGQWVWDNVLFPIFRFFERIWNDHIRHAVTALRDGVSRLFHSLGQIPDWIWQNALAPLWRMFQRIWNDHIKHAVNAMLGGIAAGFNRMGEAIARGVNVGVDALNGLITGLNWIAEKLPAMNFKINTVGHVRWSNWNPPMLAQGGPIPGQAVGAGFKTQGPRAIVGEGRQGYPEYVIPTDPRYRRNAHALLSSAIRAVGGDGASLVPMYAGGGRLARAANTAKHLPGALKGAAQARVSQLSAGAQNLAGEAADLMRGAITKFFGPINAAAENKINEIQWANLRGGLQEARARVFRWAEDEDKKLPEFGGLYTGPGAQIVGQPLQVQRMMGFLNSLGIGHIPLHSGIRYGRAAITATGKASKHGEGKAVDIPARMDLFNLIDQHYGNQAFELIFSPAGGRQKYRGRPYMYSGITRANHWDHIHWSMQQFARGGILPGVPNLAKGGIVQARRGGTIVRVGEAGQDEAVVPLPNGRNNADFGKKEYHFHGDLNFPNIRSGNDASEFLRNLESLV